MSYSISDALTFVSAIYGGRSQVFDTLGPQMCDIAQSLVWNAADWRQTIAEFPPFYLVPLEQDYGSPAIVIPSDFQGFRKMDLVQAYTEPEYRSSLDVKKTIGKTYIQGPPQQISYEAATGKVRLYPRAADFIGAADWLIDGTYKKAPTKITAANIGTATVFVPDRFYDVYRKALVYTYFDTIGDPRAGQLQWDKRSRSYVATGAIAALRAAINDMSESEAVDLGDDVRAPGVPLIPYLGL